jgi:hypothetical protein
MLINDDFLGLLLHRLYSGQCGVTNVNNADLRYGVCSKQLTRDKSLTSSREARGEPGYC